jgi:hypothetical protein
MKYTVIIGYNLDTGIEMGKPWLAIVHQMISMIT